MQTDPTAIDRAIKGGLDGVAENVRSAPVAAECFRQAYVWLYPVIGYDRSGPWDAASRSLAEGWDDPDRCLELIKAFNGLFEQVRDVDLKALAKAQLDTERFVCAVVMLAGLTIASVKRLRELTKNGGPEGGKPR